MFGSNLSAPPSAKRVRSRTSSAVGGTTPIRAVEMESNKKASRMNVVALLIALIALFAAVISTLVIVPRLAKLQAVNQNEREKAISETTSTSRKAHSLSGIAKSVNGDSRTTVVYNKNKDQCTCQCPANVWGVVNAGIEINVGGYYGWKHYSNQPDLYPIPDIHVSAGDTLVFKSRTWTPDDVWVVPWKVWNTCDFNLANGKMLAWRDELRADTDSSPGGFKLLIQDWMAQEYGNPMYFVSQYRWDHATIDGSCKNGLKLKVFVDDREGIPISSGSDDFDIESTDIIKDVQAAIGHLSRMLVLAQFSTEQRVRSQGGSGLTNVRGSSDGDASYDDGTYTNGAVASIHDHSDNIKVVGIGEIQAVLNGVEFRTRHNDYNLNKPSSTSKIYNAVEEIDPPPVPPSVLNKGTVAAQTAEMIEYFRAFKEQDTSIRNYVPYFKPILCYLEGTWIMSDGDLEEPFDSDRHFIDAKSWKQLHDKIRWMANSGRKNSLENLAHLPSAVRNLVNDTYPIISNWEYRLLCAPLKNDIPTSRFRVSDDLSVQLMGTPETREELYFSRRARFELNKFIDIDDPDGDHRFSAGRKRWNYLDYLMEQIPGKNNYGGYLTDEFPDGSEQAIHYNTDKTLNSAYYSRFYGLTGADAMGTAKHRRSWNDRYLFAAKTTQEKVSPVEFEFEMEDSNGNTVSHKTISRWSYAIPFEIIYQTPLSTWNPHKIPFYERSAFDYTKSGSCDKWATAYKGWTTNRAYFTPAGMFEDYQTDSSADTANSGVCSIDSSGKKVPIVSSGHWITFPEIANGVGKVRQRYPIFPIHADGAAAFKEVKAFQAVSLDTDYDDPVTHPDGFFGDERDVTYGFELTLEGGGHQHLCSLAGWRIKQNWYKNGVACNKWWCVVEASCEQRENHQHTVRIWRSVASDGKTWVYHLRDCRFGAIGDKGYSYPSVGWKTYDANNGYTTSCADNHNLLKR